uniref:glutathione gamma-glutamylcysteinyltransferase n=1 Tax=Oryza nivara TaxID=4536 RepID=A0A0E0HEH4_ORYNI
MASKPSSRAESNQAAAAVPSLYGRALPSPPAVEFASAEGRRLFAEALQGGTMQGFFSLVSVFQTQSEPAFCGLATLAVVLNALRIDPGRRWKGPWRWFDESMLDCCERLDTVRAEGITFGKVACLAHCSGADVRTFRAAQATLADLRRHLLRCASSQDCHLVASYHRKLLGQTGTGHFSPIGGYHAGQDMALILDVARFKYPPHWIPLPLLWEAMNTIDEATGLLRGFMLISRNTEAPLLIRAVLGDKRKEDPAQEKILQQIRDTKLFQLVHKLQCSKQPCFSCSSLTDEDSISQIAASVCCEATALLSGNLSSRDGLFFSETCSGCTQVNDEGLKNGITGKVVSEGNGHVDKLSPISSTETCFCNSTLSNETVNYPSNTDILTVLLLSLHPSTWLCIEDEKLKAEFQSLVSTDDLPDPLKLEVCCLTPRTLH